MNGRKSTMDRTGSTKNLIKVAAGLPKRRGTRPITISGPIHVQCGDHGEDKILHSLIEEVIAWPHVEAGPLPVGSANFLSLQLSEELAIEEPSVFIIGREFGRVLFGSPTIYLTLPLSCAHWAIVRGWAEPHFSSSFGIMPPGVMVVYAPRDDREAAVCRSLFRVAYDYSLHAGKNEIVEPKRSSFEVITKFNGESPERNKSAVDLHRRQQLQRAF
jgi:hypothetical protein